MVQNKNRIFDEFARLTTDAIGAAQGLKREAETILRSGAEKLVKDMDFASNEEVAVLRDMVASLKAENEDLRKRVEALEGTAPKPAARKKAAK
jgi:Uncharacterized protein conserved in bacteria